jgi:hypothetical protein
MDDDMLLYITGNYVLFSKNNACKSAWTQA